MLRSFIARSFLWKSITGSNWYFKLRDPKGFARFKKELDFYKGLLERRPEKNNLIFDIGANMGRKSFFFSKLSKNVFAFEPGDRLYNYLIRRFKNSNVEIVNSALGSSISVAQYYQLEDNQAYNSLSEKHLKTTVYKNGISTNAITGKKVDIITLEKCIEDYGSPKYIKIDVEGYEEEVIKGLKRIIPIISFEANLPDFKEETTRIINYLDELSSFEYRYNYTKDLSFILPEFISGEEMQKIIANYQGTYMEIYVVLNH